MRKALFATGFCLLLTSHQLFAQAHLNWASSFSPSWSNGALSRSATNVGGYSIDCTTSISMNGAGSFSPVNGASGPMSPSVNAAFFTVPGSGNKIQVTPNFIQHTSFVTIEMSFTSLITNVNFRIADIDKSSAYSDSYYDRVTVTGSDGSSTYYPVLTKYDAVTDPDFLVISGHTAHVNTANGQAGNTASDATDQRGTITVSFGSAAISSISIRYDNAPGTDNNPAVQSIAIGEIAFSTITLPVRLAGFRGHRAQQDVLLEWRTKQEYHSAAFEIERSVDNGSWEKIGSVAAAGTSYDNIDYSYRDINPQGSVLLYRLRQVDIDNRFNYSPVVRISAGSRDKGLRAYPNPFIEQVSIGLYSALQQQVTLTVADIAGKRIKTETRKLHAGENNFPMTMPSPLSPGLYQVMVTDQAGNPMGQVKLLKK